MYIELQTKSMSRTLVDYATTEQGMLCETIQGEVGGKDGTESREFESRLVTQSQFLMPGYSKFSLPAPDFCRKLQCAKHLTFMCCSGIFQVHY